MRSSQAAATCADGKGHLTFSPEQQRAALVGTYKYIGEHLLSNPDGLSEREIQDQQALVQTLYETRMASLQRLLGFMVVFHAMGGLVQTFWRVASLGALGYDMSRTQSIMRVATTASPVSGSGVRTRMIELGNEQVQEWAARVIQRNWGFARRLRGRRERARASGHYARLKTTISGASAMTPSAGFQMEGARGAEGSEHSVRERAGLRMPSMQEEDSSAITATPSDSPRSKPPDTDEVEPLMASLKSMLLNSKLAA